MKYRLYFVFPAAPALAPARFDPQGFVAYYHWLKALIGDNAIGGGFGMADLAETQPIFGNDYTGLFYFDFTDRLLSFDSIDKHGFVDVLDKMLEFTDIPPVMQGVFMMDEYENTPAAVEAPAAAEVEKKNLSHVLERYVDRMSANDAIGITDCWTEEAVFDDESAMLLTGKPGYCVGKKEILATFKKMFLFKPKAEIIKMYDNGLEMDYDIHILGKVIPCHGKIEEDKDGKFRVYSCRPRV